MSTNRKWIFTTFILYTLFILYCMFFSFDRMDSSANLDEYTFMWMPNSFYILPDVSDLFPPSIMALVSFGNTAAFIPLGILIPLLYRLSFLRFIGGFIVCILFLEMVQSLTKLGSFDINDVIQNSWGAAIGYGAYKLGTHGSTILSKVAITVLSAIVLMAATMVVNKGIEELLTQRQGSFKALTEWTDSQGNSGQPAAVTPFTIGGQKVSPQFNVYHAEDGKSTTYTYNLDGEDMYLFVNYGIPDGRDPQGGIRLSVDGQETLSDSAEYQGGAPVKFYWYFEKAKKITITLDGSETMWDLGYRKMKYVWE